MRAGVKIFEGTRVQRVCTTDGEVSSVVTSKGTIKCNYFVNAAGMVSYASFWNEISF